MEERREVTMPSGAILRIQIAPFVASKNLYQAVLKHLKEVKISDDLFVPDMLKNAFCVGYSSPEIEKCMWECLKSCTYEVSAGDGEHKITTGTFEPVVARDDYMKVLVEVAKDNIGPFIKSLYADFKAATDWAESTKGSDLKSL